MTNVELARRTIEEVRSAGIENFCVCSGSRNAPLLAVLAATKGIRLYSFIDERSAAFFALGLAKRTGHPACVVTTSGTAVAELLPAAIEAFYSGIPMVLLTADRPSRFRGSGAPQSIEQEAIFGPYAVRDLHEWDGCQPLHLNVEFEEPLIDGPVLAAAAPALKSRRQKAPADPAAALEVDRPLVVVGSLGEHEREPVRRFLEQLNAPVYAEPLSGLREDERLREILVTNERMLPRGNFRGVIRVGGVPTFRFWRDLDERLVELPVVSFSNVPLPGLGRGSVHPLEALPQANARERDIEFFALDREMRERFARILDAEPQSELAMMRALSHELPSMSRIYLGNSLPVREWDLVATREARGFAVEANRGANGIDGQLATFFGWCQRDTHNVAIVGDLTTLYDMNAPWIVPQIDGGFRIIIINNSGGRIFERVPGLRALESDIRSRVVDNAHAIHFAGWAEMWSLDYAWISRLPAGTAYRAKTREVMELVPDLEASRRVWRRYDALWE